MANTKEYRAKVLAELKPIADALNIDFDYIDNGKREYISCNGQNICVNGTSIYGMKQELMGYAFISNWRERSLGSFDKQTRNYIKQYWYDKNFNQPWLNRK